MHSSLLPCVPVLVARLHDGHTLTPSRGGLFWIQLDANVAIAVPLGVPNTRRFSVACPGGAGAILARPRRKVALRGVN